MKRVFGLVLFFGLLILVSRFQPFLSIRSYLEKTLILPFFRISQEGRAVNLVEVQSLREKVRKLNQENQILRRQLGAIPERSNLIPAEIIRETPSNYFLRYSYLKKSVFKGQPVVLGEVYLGRVERVGGRLLVIEKPISSGFRAEGRSEKGTEGMILGKFNEQIIFETGVNNKLEKGEAVYLIDSEHAWRFLLGTVSEISRDKRMPVKQAVINYLPAQAILTTVFVVE